jgi:hypothetical protein
MLFCDFTPPLSRLAEFAAAGAIVLDHHDVDLAPFGERGIRGDNTKGESGAALALREVYRVLKWSRVWPGQVEEARAVERLAALAAIRDTWQRDSVEWKEACELSEVLRFAPLNDVVAKSPPAFMRLAEDLGPMLRRKVALAAQEAARNAVRWTIAGRRVAVLSTGAIISDAADVLAAEADLVVAFDYVQEPARVRLKVGLRSVGAVNCTAIAKAHGGGGHPSGRTAGFYLSVDVDALESKAPFATLRALLEASL